MTAGIEPPQGFAQETHTVTKRVSRVLSGKATLPLVRSRVVHERLLGMDGNILGDPCRWSGFVE